MFRAIDPDGLVAVAGQLAQRADRVCRQAALASAVLGRRAGGDGASALVQTARWADETAADLRWRADAIRAGQEGGFSPLSLLRAEFAATGVFTPGEPDVALVSWLHDREASRATVAGAVARISGWLEQGWLDWDVTNRDLHNIEATMASLTSDELDRVIAALSHRQLERWIAEMGHSLNGFSREEKQDVFELLAGSISGESLHRVHGALLSEGGRKELLDFGRAIQFHSPGLAIAEFVAETMAGDLVDRPFSLLAPGEAIRGLQDPDAMAKAVGTILETHHAVAWFVADSVAAGESPDGLLTALVATTDGDQIATGLAGVFALLASPTELDRVIGARHPNASAAGEHLPHPLLAETREHLLGASVRFIAAAPEAAFAHLATVADPNGDLTSAFWHQLVNRGDAESIAAVLEGLRGGPEVDLKRLSSRGTDPEYEYPHARNLAYAAATLNRGLAESAREAQGNIDAIGRVAGVATTVAGILSGGSAVVESLIGTGTGWGIDSHTTAVKNDIDNQLARVIDAATAGLRPPDGVDLQQFPGAANALLAWLTVYTRLLPSA